MGSISTYNTNHDDLLGDDSSSNRAIAFPGMDAPRVQGIAPPEEWLHDEVEENLGGVFHFPVFSS
eukprot:TRINITY_DN15749_c0_g1_i1.p1 TRINITY_DN15749_c0_g1~~TRINITY_DN15749_c0_g1_i1.p1  ORF type:complete len:65 (-),score=7.54 TRINITY_DN15749_c0_g1_i1:212-406(-)